MRALAYVMVRISWCQLLVWLGIGLRRREWLVLGISRLRSRSVGRCGPLILREIAELVLLRELLIARWPAVLVWLWLRLLIVGRVLPSWVRIGEIVIVTSRLVRIAHAFPSVSG